MEKLLAILKDIDPDIDYENEEHLIDDGLLDSMQVLELVSTLEDEFDIEVQMCRAGGLASSGMLSAAFVRLQT